MCNIQEVLHKSLFAVEQVLNFSGYIPLFSTYSGGKRIKYGSIECIGGLAAAALTAITALWRTQDQNHSRKAAKLSVKTLVIYSFHGFANMFRGSLEAVPFLSWVTCLPYDLLGYRLGYSNERFQFPSRVEII